MLKILTRRYEQSVDPDQTAPLFAILSVPLDTLDDSQTW